MNYPATSSQQLYPHTEQLVPRKQQWALINQFKAIQFERMKQMEKQIDIEKKRNFKQQLDSQIQNKSNVNAQQKESDRKYYEFITKKAEESKEKQDRQKYNKIMKRKQMQQENQFYLDRMRNSRNKDYDSGYHLDIGHKSEIQRKNMEQSHKKQMLDTLDRQLQMKMQQKRQQRLNNMEQDEANLKYQQQQYERRRNPAKNFSQNQNVYMYYKNLEQDRRIRQRQFEHRIVDEAAVRKMQQQDYKLYTKDRIKAELTSQMKNTLDQQVHNHQRKVQQQKRVNPEEHSYSIIGNMFKQKQLPYNKQQYSEYLRRQAEEANMKKKREQYMSEEEYRINMNQLNRAVSGTYAYNKYLDRSVGAIGDNKRINLTQMNQKVNDEDSEVVKMRLQSLRSRIPRGNSPKQNSMYV